MTDARANFFANMERELLESFDGPSPSTTLNEAALALIDRAGTAGLDFDFSLTESGRTVAHMVTGSQRVTDFSMTSDLNTLVEEEPDESAESRQHQKQTMPARSIPVPNPSPYYSSAMLQPPSYSQPSSQGSSGSAFLSSVLNSNATNFNGPHNTTSLLSHTPPTSSLGSSYEISHFGKRARSGSVSGRLRSASEYLEDKGLLDRNTKSMLKDLIIIGDEELQRALDVYETEGDATALEQMISSGALQDRLPPDLDLMNDLDLDFLDINDTISSGVEYPNSNIEDIATASARAVAQQLLPPTMSSGLLTRRQQLKQQQQQQTLNQHNSRTLQSSLTGQQYHDDGIGDLDFNELVVPEDDVGSSHFMSHQQQPPPTMMYTEQAGDGGAASGVKQAPPETASSPATVSTISSYDRRLRSNSLFSALMNDPSLTRAREDSISFADGISSITAAAALTTNTDATQGDSHYNDWMDQYLGPLPSSVNSSSGMQGIEISKPALARRSTSSGGGIGASLEEAEKSNKMKEKKEKKEKDSKEPAKKGRKPKAKKEDKKNKSDDERPEHVPGSGLPRSLSDPCFQTTSDEFGLRHVERPDGWVGAYSPNSRKVRIERFLEKRNHRVWSKTIKYDVRKNFADSRLRVKGRFVRKEDEVLMRELMSLT